MNSPSVSSAKTSAGGLRGLDADDARAVPPKQVHLISNAHLDPVWLWEWQEGASAALSTFRAAAGFCEEYPDFVFNHNESVLYEWVEEYEPALFRRIQTLVKQGRWRIMGGWFLQPDCNLPAGEALIRQMKRGRTYFRKKFGVLPKTAVNFDPFGHARGLVQILRGGGYENYVICRPFQEDCPLESEEFLWEGYDGSRVCVSRGFGLYLSALGKAAEKVQNVIDGRPNKSVDYVLWGVGNHGGGPSRADIAMLAEMARRRAPITQIFHSDLDAFWVARRRASSAPLPIVARALNPFAVGCYTSQIRIKQRYRALENEFLLTERMCSAAWCQQRMDYPGGELAVVERDMLFAQFHDILPGSSIQAAEVTSLRLMDHGLEIASRLKWRAFFALTREQPAGAAGTFPVYVYNHHPHAFETEIDCEIQLADQNWTGTISVPTVRQNGRVVLSQLEQEASNISIDWRKKIVFRARLAAFSVNRFDVRFKRIPSLSWVRSDRRWVARKALRLSNGELEIHFDPRTGGIRQLKVDEQRILRRASRFLVMQTDADPWSMSHKSFRTEIGAFIPLSPQEAGKFLGFPGQVIAPIRVVETGAVRTVVESLLKFGRSRMVVRYSVPVKGRRIRVDIRVFWQETDRMLKLSLPTALVRAQAFGESVLGHEMAVADGSEQVAQQWVLVSDRNWALSVINLGTYGYDFAGGELRLSLLRSAAYAAHPIPGKVLVTDRQYRERIDQGERFFTFFIECGPAAGRIEQIPNEALQCNQPVTVVNHFPPTGGAGVEKPFLRLSNPVVQLLAAKRSDEGDHLVLRFFNPTAQMQTTRLFFGPFPGNFSVRLNRFEISTLVVNRTTAKCWKTDLLERRPS